MFVHHRSDFDILSRDQPCFDVQAFRCSLRGRDPPLLQHAALAKSLPVRPRFLNGWWRPVIVTVHADARPLNSALEVDLDFERAIVPPPQPSVEAMQSLEEMIRRRIADHQFDDPPRLAPPAPERKRPEIELDDSRSKKVCCMPGHPAFS